MCQESSKRDHNAGSAPHQQTRPLSPAQHNVPMLRTMEKWRFDQSTIALFKFIVQTRKGCAVRSFIEIRHGLYNTVWNDV